MAKERSSKKTKLMARKRGTMKPALKRKPETPAVPKNETSTVPNIGATNSNAIVAGIGLPPPLGLGFRGQTTSITPQGGGYDPAPGTSGSTPKTRLSPEGYGARRAGSFHGKTATDLSSEELPPETEGDQRHQPASETSAWQGPDQTGDQIRAMFEERQRRFIGADTPLVLKMEAVESSPDVVSAFGEVTAAPTDPRILHQEMLQRLTALESVIAALPRPAAGIGHNRFPELIDGAFDEGDYQAVVAAIDILKVQPALSTASPETAAAASTLRRVGERLWYYLVKQLDTIVSEAAKSFGAELGKRAVQLPFWWILASSLLAVSIAAVDWLAALSALN